MGKFQLLTAPRVLILDQNIFSDIVCVECSVLIGQGLITTCEASLAIILSIFVYRCNYGYD